MRRIEYDPSKFYRFRITTPSGEYMTDPVRGDVADTYWNSFQTIPGAQIEAVEFHSLVRVESIRFTFSESYAVGDLEADPIQVDGWESATAVLLGWAAAMGETEVCNKVDYVARFKDGTEYAGQYDLCKGVTAPCLSGAMRDHLSYVANMDIDTPAANFLKITIERQAECRNFLTTYDLPRAS